MAKKPVLKPDRPFGVVVYPKAGRPYARVEHPPRIKEELELTIGRKFLGALKRFQNIDLADLRRAEEPADLACIGDRGLVQIQIAEIINHDWRRVTDMRESYATRFEEENGRLLERFSGCRVTLVDSGEPPYLPAVDAPDGKACLAELADGLTTIADDIGTLLVKKRRTRKISVGRHQRAIHVTIERVVDVEGQAGHSFRWTGGSPGRPASVPMTRLSDAVAHKIGKRYDKPSGDFWLLVYSRDEMIMPGNEDLPRASVLLARERHPFDRAWYLWPYDNQDLGHLVEVWSRKTSS